MYIERIELQNFRNYESLSLDFDKNVNIFLGENAQGKTNLLESIYLSALAKSFRTNKDSELISFDSDHAKVKLDVNKDDDSLLIEILITKDAKGIKIDGQKIRKTSDLIENVYAVIFSPEDLKIVKDEPEKRRRFLDMEMCQLSPSYYLNLSNYKKVLKQRNILLKDIRYIGSQELADTLSVWNEKLAEYGSKIMIQRLVFIEKLKKISNKLHFDISGGIENLDISYESNIKLDKIDNFDSISLKNAENNLKNYILSELNLSYENDLRNGTTTIGPHKDDLKLSISGIDIRKFGSQGQQRTAALSLKLAEIKLIKEETGENAILLLDDVMSELDSKRQSFLISSLSDVQLFITTTELSDEVKNALPKGKTFIVKQGKINE